MCVYIRTIRGLKTSACIPPRGCISSVVTPNEDIRTALYIIIDIIYYYSIVCERTHIFQCPIIISRSVDIQMAARRTVSENFHCDTVVFVYKSWLKISKRGGIGIYRFEKSQRTIERLCTYYLKPEKSELCFLCSKTRLRRSSRDQLSRTSCAGIILA